MKPLNGRKDEEPSAPTSALAHLAQTLFDKPSPPPLSKKIADQVGYWFGIILSTTVTLTAVWALLMLARWLWHVTG